MLKRRHNFGFTLLEILLVMILFSLTAVVVVPTFPNKSNDDAKLEAERFYHLIQLWNENALVTGRIMGVRVEEDSYILMELSGDDWQKAPSNKRLASSVKMPEGVSLEISVEGLINQEDQLFSRESLFDDMDFNEEDEDTKVEPPQLVMMGNGELFSFDLIFSANNENLWQVSGTDVGAFVVTPFGEDE